MGKVKKSTKKFNKEKLAKVIQQRKDNRKGKQLFEKRQQDKTKRRSINESKDLKEAGQGTGYEFEKLVTKSTRSVTDSLFDQLDQAEVDEVESEAESEIEEEDVSEDEVDLNQVDDESDDEDNDMEVEEKVENEEDVEGSDEEEEMDLEKLKETDTTFFKYLQENNKQLLELNINKSNKDGEEIEELDENNSSDGEMEVEGKQEGDTKKRLSLETVLSWEKSIKKKKSIKAFKNLVKAFETGAHINDLDSTFKHYSIRSDKVLNKIITASMETIPKLLNHFLTDKNNKKQAIDASPNWHKLQPLVKSYLSNLIFMLEQLTEPTMTHYLLERCASLLDYVLIIPKRLKSLLKVAFQLFTADQPKIQLTAFSIIRKLCTKSTYALDTSLKLMYTGYLSNCKVVNQHTLPKIQLMRACGIELLSNQFDKAYQLGFLSIRRLAITLRKAKLDMSTESNRKVYNWQFVMALHFWSAALTTYCNSSAELQHGASSTLRPLIHPFVQVALGTLSLIPSAKYFPLRFQLLKLVQEVSQKVDLYVPIVPYLIEVTESIEFRRRSTKSTAKPIDLDLHIKCPNHLLHTNVYQNLLIDALVDSLLTYLATNCTSVAFPEMVTPVLTYFKKVLKQCNQPRLSEQLQPILQKAQLTLKLVLQRRTQLKFTPNSLLTMKTQPLNLELENPILEYFKIFTQLKLNQQEQLRQVKDSDEDSDLIEMED